MPLSYIDTARIYTPSPMTTTHKTHSKQLHNYIRQFENQFNCRLKQSGHMMRASENGGVHAEEYTIQDLIDTGTGMLEFSVGGWFELDTRGDEPTVYATLAVRLNGQRIGTEGPGCLNVRYHADEGRWGQIRVNIR